MSVSRVMLFDNLDNPLGDLPPEFIHSLQRTEVINGEHSLKISTSKRLEQGQRILMQDGMLKWYEYVVNGVDEAHQDGSKPIGTYTAIWSLQYDLYGTICDKQPGIKSGVTAREALIAALSGTKRWNAGTVNVGTTAGASMWQMSAYEALGVLVKTWGGEIDAQITVGPDGVTARQVALYSSQGKAVATRRFDYSSDLVSIRRKASDGPLYCRVVPLGAGYADSADSSDTRRRVTIESLTTGNVEWLQNDAMVNAARVPDGAGGWEYPTKFVIYDGIQAPEELLSKALADLDNQTVPKVSYTASVLQFGQAGVDFKGVALGDVVQVVDSKFYSEGLAFEARITKLVIDELNPADSTVTLGTVDESLAGKFAAINNQISTVANYVDTTNIAMVDYVNNVLNEVNARVNATGGYTYLVPGRGCVTYDVAVPDLSDDSAASQVTEIRGGTLRFANSRDSSGNWEYKTVILSGYLNTELIEAQSITAAKISTSLMDIITEWGDYIYTVRGGLLITQPNSAIGALVNSSGSFDVVRVSWVDDVPSVASTLNKFGTVIELCNELLRIRGASNVYSGLISNNVYIESEQYQIDADGNEIIDTVYDHPYSVFQIDTIARGDGKNSAGAQIRTRYNNSGFGANVIAEAAENYTVSGVTINDMSSGVATTIAEMSVNYFGSSGKTHGSIRADEYDVANSDEFQSAIETKDFVNNFLFDTDSTLIENGTNLNNLFTHGSYVTGNNSAISNILNLPIANTATRLIVFASFNGTGYHSQLAITYTNRWFIRSYNPNGSGWTDWYELLSSKNAYKVTYSDYMDFFTPDTSVINVDNAVLAKSGNVISISIVFTTVNTISVPANGNITNLTIGTINSGFRPAVRTGGHSGSTGEVATFYIGANGAIQIAALDARGGAYTLPANTSLEVCATYVCA